MSVLAELELAEGRCKVDIQPSTMAEETGRCGTCQWWDYRQDEKGLCSRPSALGSLMWVPGWLCTHHTFGCIQWEELVDA